MRKAVVPGHGREQKQGLLDSRKEAGGKTGKKENKCGYCLGLSQKIA